MVRVAMAPPAMALAAMVFVMKMAVVAMAVVTIATATTPRVTPTIATAATGMRAAVTIVRARANARHGQIQSANAGRATVRISAAGRTAGRMAVSAARRAMIALGAVRVAAGTTLASRIAIASPTHEVAIRTDPRSPTSLVAALLAARVVRIAAHLIAKAKIMAKVAATARVMVTAARRASRTIATPTGRGRLMAVRVRALAHRVPMVAGVDVAMGGRRHAVSRAFEVEARCSPQQRDLRQLRGRTMRVREDLSWRARNPRPSLNSCSSTFFMRMGR